MTKLSQKGYQVTQQIVNNGEYKTRYDVRFSSMDAIGANRAEATWYRAKRSVQ